MMRLSCFTFSVRNTSPEISWPFLAPLAEIDFNEAFDFASHRRSSASTPSTSSGLNDRTMEFKNNLRVGGILA